ncbi:MAG: family 16 glycosylhydrolase, partial [Planctomycetota bacterium]|nr:family 16 glycosylhydrolase [Planctomycetota bacterium]
MLAAPVIQRSKEGLVSLSAAPGVEIRYWLEGPHATPSSKKYTEPFPLPLGGVVKALAIAPDGADCIVLGESTLSQAEFGVAKGKWKIAYVSSEEAPGEAAANAIDDNPKTIWHSEYKKKQPPCPHEIQVDLGETVEMAGFTCLPRDNAQDGGSVCSKYEFYASADGKEWVLQTVKFEKPVSARFFRFVAVAECKGGPHVSVAELGVLPNAPKPPAPKAPTAGWADLKPAPLVPAKRTTDDFPLSDQENKSGWVKYEPMSDEFNGDKLDETKWWPFNPTWKGRYPGLFRKENVTVSGGQMHLTMKKEPIPAMETDKKYKDYTCAAVQSKDTVRYGYFEVRSKAMNSAGSSSFWFYHSTKPWWTEIDVYEIGGKAPGKEKNHHITMHVFYTPNENKHWQVGSAYVAANNLADDYYVYGLEWDENDLKFYFDGVLVRKGPNTHWHQPLTLNFDSETMPEWFG